MVIALRIRLRCRPCVLLFRYTIQYCARPEISPKTELLDCAHTPRVMNRTFVEAAMQSFGNAAAARIPFRLYIARDQRIPERLVLNPSVA